MIGKKSSLSIYKIGSLAILLGIFGLFGSSVFAALGTPSCSKTQAANISSVRQGHGYTCQQNTPTLAACGTTSNKQSCMTPVKGDTCSLKCCICTQEVALTAEACKNKGQVLSGGVCVGCPNGGTTDDGVNCNALGNGLGSITADTCKNQGKILSGGVCASCVSPQIPNTAGTACENKKVDKVECTSPQKQDALGGCNACEDGYQWNSSKEGSNKCEDCNADGVCCGVKLNTNVPFVGKCIRTDTTNADGKQTTTTPTTAFPKLMGALVKIMTTVILLICFGGILVGGVMIASSGGETKRASDGKALIGKVVIAIAVLGASGIILHLINPNFFG